MKIEAMLLPPDARSARRTWRRSRAAAKSRRQDDQPVDLVTSPAVVRTPASWILDACLTDCTCVS